MTMRECVKWRECRESIIANLDAFQLNLGLRGRVLRYLRKGKPRTSAFCEGGKLSGFVGEREINLDNTYYFLLLPRSLRSLWILLLRPMKTHKLFTLQSDYKVWKHLYFDQNSTNRKPFWCDSLNRGITVRSSDKIFFWLSAMNIPSHSRRTTRSFHRTHIPIACFSAVTTRLRAIPGGAFRHFGWLIASLGAPLSMRFLFFS